MPESKKKVIVRNRPLFEVKQDDDDSRLPFDWQTAAKALAKADPKLGKVIKAVGPARLKLQGMQNCFETLTESIVYQQLTGKAAATILGRVKELYGDRFPTPIEILKTDEDKLREVGLSRAKAMALLDLSEKTANGKLPVLEDLHAMDDDEIIETFSSVRGIGEWTVQMLLIFRLGRPDVLPANDYGVRKGFARAYKHAELPTPKELIAHGEKWRPYRSVAAWYLWRVLD